MREVTRPYYFDPEISGGYYVIKQQADGGYIWEWNEPALDPDFSQHPYETISEALLAAAKDWDYSGSGGGFSKRLRQAAAAAHRKEDS